MTKDFGGKYHGIVVTGSSVTPEQAKDILDNLSDLSLDIRQMDKGCWVSPDGFIDGNFTSGKWPNEEEIVNDLTVLGEAFPYLDIRVQILAEDAPENWGKPRSVIATWALNQGVVTKVKVLPASKVKVLPASKSNRSDK